MPCSQISGCAQDIRPAGFLLETVQIGKELAVDEIAQVVAGQHLVVVELTVGSFRCGPAFPAVGRIEDEGVLLALQPRLHGLVLLQAIQAIQAIQEFQEFQEQQPRGLLDVVQFAGTTSLFPEDVVDIFESLFEHGSGRFRGDGLYEAEGANITGIDVIGQKA